MAHSPAPDADRDAVLTEARRLRVARPPSILDRAPSSWTGPARAYYSIGKYAWPDPDAPDGLPYRRHDCEVNPAAAGPAYDRTRLATLVRECRTLALAWLLQPDPGTTDALAARLRTWFVDPATAMEPHLRHAAALPGVHDGSWLGLIEGARLVGLVDDLDLVAAREPTPSLRQALAGTRAWMARFADWYRTSEQGRRDAAATNNHGLWYHLQTLAWAAFADPADRDLPLLRERLTASALAQVGPAGTLPQELARPNALGYVVFTLLALAAATERLEPHGTRLLEATTPSGARVGEAFTWLAEHAHGLDGDPDEGGEPGRRAVLAWWVAERYPDHTGAAALAQAWSGTATTEQRVRRTLGLRDWT